VTNESLPRAMGVYAASTLGERERITTDGVAVGELGAISFLSPLWRAGVENLCCSVLPDRPLPRPALTKDGRFSWPLDVFAFPSETGIAPLEGEGSGEYLLAWLPPGLGGLVLVVGLVPLERGPLASAGVSSSRRRCCTWGAVALGPLPVASTFLVAIVPLFANLGDPGGGKLPSTAVQ
jgi:hypothetical protein